MSHLKSLLFILTFLSLVSGCGPALDKVKEMRDVQDAGRARKNQIELLKAFAEHKKKPVWRAETMTTLTEIDRRFQMARTDSELHHELTALLKEECENPKVATSNEADRHRVRAFAVYSLGKVDRPEFQNFFLAVLEENCSLKKDPGFEICTAALNGLVPDVERLAAQPYQRDRLLGSLAAISAGTGGPGHVRLGIRRLLPFFRSRVATYNAVVGALPGAGDTQEMPDTAVLELLKWDYQELDAGARDRESDEVFQRNLDKLVALAWHKNRDVRTRARIILEKFAPFDLFDALEEHVGGHDEQPEDYEQLAALLRVTDQLADQGRAPTGYKNKRAEAIPALFAHTADAPVTAREIMYGVLFGEAPETLAQHLLAINATVLSENDEKVLQQVRFLGHLRDKLGSSEELDDKLARAIALFMRKPSTPVRKQVVAQLWVQKPILLAESYAPAFRECASEGPEAAEYLVDSYLALLEEIEDRDAFASLEPHPYELLTFVMGRPEAELKEKVIDFLGPRDPKVLIKVLADGVSGRPLTAKASAQDYTLLYEAARRYHSKLDQESLDLVVDTIREGVFTGAEEQRLLCCCYLMELGAPVAPSERDRLPESLRRFLDEATQESVQVTDD